MGETGHHYFSTITEYLLLLLPKEYHRTDESTIKRLGRV